MKIPIWAYPRKVKSAVPGWSGWRLVVRYIGHDKGCQGCDCAVVVDMPVFFPKAERNRYPQEGKP